MKTRLLMTALLLTLLCGSTFAQRIAAYGDLRTITDPEREAPMRHGKIEGTVRTWFAYGKPDRIQEYKEGKKNGKLDGKLYAYKCGSFKNGYKHGDWTEIDDRGIVTQGEYTDGRETGHWMRFDHLSGEILNEWDK